MNRDLRDPLLLGNVLLRLAGWTGSVREAMDVVITNRDGSLFQTPNYDANPSCIEKYGRPQDLPSTLPN